MCAAGPTMASSALAQEEESVVARVEITGNSAFKSEEIRRAIATEPSRCKSLLAAPLCALGFDAFRDQRAFDPDEVQLDVARIKLFYWRRGYREAQVDAQVRRRDHDAGVTFEIREGEPVRVRGFGIAGLGGIVRDTAGLRRRLSLRVGEPFSVVAVEASRNQIEQLLRNRGYAHAQVLLDALIPREDPRSADVVFQVEPGPLSRIGQIRVVGGEEVEPRVVRRLLTFRQGELYRENEIYQSQRRLYAVELFQYADVVPQLERKDSIVDVTVRVSEARVRAVREGVGVSTSDCVQVEAAWAHRNFLGGARRLEVSSGLSNLLTPSLAGRFPCSQAGDTLNRSSPFNKMNWIARVGFQEPWFFSSRNSLRLGVFAQRQSLPLIYARVTYGGDVALERQIGSRTPLVLAYRTERDSLDAGSASVFFCANFGFCLPQDLRELAQPRWLSWISIGITRDRTDAIFNPTRGYVARVEVEHASRFTHSDYAYSRAWADVSAFKSVGGSVLAFRARPGWVGPIGRGIEFDGLEAPAPGPDVVHPLKRFYAGGANTVRGFGQNLLGPLALLLPQLDTLELGCSRQTIDTVAGVWRACDAGPLPAEAFQLRPVGGIVSLVANLEFRFPLFGQNWSGAAFVDIGAVWRDEEEFEAALRRGLLRDLVWTPGFGIRYRSPVGPLRMDLGYNTTGSRTFPVVTQVDLPAGAQVVQLEQLYRYDPFSDPSAFREFLNRLQIHFSLGQAF